MLTDDNWMANKDFFLMIFDVSSSGAVPIQFLSFLCMWKFHVGLDVPHRKTTSSTWCLESNMPSMVHTSLQCEFPCTSMCSNYCFATVWPVSNPINDFGTGSFRIKLSRFSCSKCSLRLLIYCNKQTSAKKTGILWLCAQISKRAPMKHQST